MTEPEDLPLIILAAALEEILEQAEYFESRSGPDLTHRWGLAVSRTLQSLQAMPYRGELCLLPPTQLKEIRRVPVPGFERYNIFYKAGGDPPQLTIVAVLHAARDIALILSTPRE